MDEAGEVDISSTAILGAYATVMLSHRVPKRIAQRQQRRRYAKGLN
jgi:hypothetical protein